MRPVFLLLAMTAPAWAQIVAAPMQSDGSRLAYPRLTQFPDAGVKAAVNAALAAQEKADRDSRADCLKQIREAKQTPDADSYHASIRVAYLSRRYLSVEAHSGYYCGGPYPTNDDSTPLTFDLTAGKALDWDSLFKPGFVTPPDGKKAGLWALYQARYAKSDQDKDCNDSVAEDDSATLHLWLDGKRGGLVVQPEFPHVIEACAEEFVFKPAELAPYARPELIADLKGK